MKIVVDTNIIFSALLNSNGAIGTLLFYSDPQFEFYSCAHMQTEIRRHWPKLLKISKLTDADLNRAYEQVTLKIKFIQEELIPEAVWADAEALVMEIDPDDADFVALANYLRGSLWTGDKVLYQGLRALGFQHIFTTSDLLDLRRQPRDEPDKP